MKITFKFIKDNLKTCKKKQKLRLRAIISYLIYHRRKLINIYTDTLLFIFFFFIQKKVIKLQTTLIPYFITLQNKSISAFTN